MYLLEDGTLVTSASDLTTASGCEFAFLRRLDMKLGWWAGDEPEPDAMLKRTSDLGGVHEQRLLQRYRSEYGESLVELVKLDKPTTDQLREHADRTLQALRDLAPVVYQGVFYDETDPSHPFVGYADFLKRQEDSRYRVIDTKLARHVKVTALLQLAAYHEQLVKLGVPVDDTVELILGDDQSETFHIDDIRPVFQRRRERMRSLVQDHRAAGQPVQWGDDRYAIDGRCTFCEQPAAEADDLITVARMSLTQRDKLRSAGIYTLTDLAETPDRPRGCEIPEITYKKLQSQAVMQAKARTPDPSGKPPYSVIDPARILALPEPSAGDLFFDFEGDPLYSEQQPDGTQRWGLDYLFGWVDADEQFACLWAHDQASEADALRQFLDFVYARLQIYPDLHIYHYAPYEKTHLLSIAARHGVGEDLVDDLLRDGRLVDLYPVVTSSLRVGTRSYSIKKLEPLYMDDATRQGVDNAAESIEQYVEYCKARDAGDTDLARQILDDIAQYNAYDCRSTLKLRDWLLQLPELAGMPRATMAIRDVDTDKFEESELDLDLQQLASEAHNDNRSADANAYSLSAAAVDFYRRERKSYWWEHFHRLNQPAEDWQDDRDIFTVERVEVIRDWHLEGRQRKPRRHLRLYGMWGPGSATPRGGGDAFALYDEPRPNTVEGVFARYAHHVQFLEASDEINLVTILETHEADAEAWHDTPTHLTPGAPPRTASLEGAIHTWGAELVAIAPEWPSDAASQLLRRRPADESLRLFQDEFASDPVGTVVRSLLSGEIGYLAVQGPPGTGKTYLAANTIKHLVEQHHWAVGVTAQSHKVIENVLNATVREAKLDPNLVGKKRSSEDSTGDYVDIPERAFREFAADRVTSGYVVGGTAWDMTNRNRIDPSQLDLLVIDEAGQFSLANTLSVAPSAKRLLLLGDPQQLPQVSQGIHPAPVDGSALGHIIGSGSSVLNAQFGYFLATSRRMDSKITDVVSRLSYDGELHSHPTTQGRALDGVEAGLHPIQVNHRGNANASAEEAEVVVDLVRQHLGRDWVEAKGDVRRPLVEHDIIVVTPFNAQVEQIRLALTEFGVGDVRVGTVDKFQGQEAVVSLISLAASEAAEVPRGIDFLLNRNRLNVAISRAKWAAYLVHSPALMDYLPARPDGLATLSRFITLVEV